MFLFLSLPREIRDMIYENALNLPYLHAHNLELDSFWTQQSGSPPSRGLLLANKQIRDEFLDLGKIKKCLHLLRHRKIWRSLTKTSYTRYGFKALRRVTAGGTTVYQQHGHLVHSVSLDFPRREKGILHTWMTHPHWRPPWVTESDAIHIYGVNSLALWTTRKHILASIANLRRLDIDFENHFFPYGPHAFNTIFEEIIPDAVAKGVEVHLHRVDQITYGPYPALLVERWMVVVHPTSDRDKMRRYLDAEKCWS